MQQEIQAQKMYPVNFLHGDYYKPNAISTLLNAYYKTNADLVIGEFTNVDEKTGERDSRLIFERCGTALQ